MIANLIIIGDRDLEMWELSGRNDRSVFMDQRFCFSSRKKKTEDCGNFRLGIHCRGPWSFTCNY